MRLLYPAWYGRGSKQSVLESEIFVCFVLFPVFDIIAVLPLGQQYQACVVQCCHANGCRPFRLSECCFHFDVSHHAHTHRDGIEAGRVC